MHEMLYAAAPAAGAAWWGIHAWVRRRSRPRAGISETGGPGAGFRLQGTDGQWHDLAAMHEPVVVILFMSNDCPGVKAYDGRLRALIEEFPSVRFLAVNPIDESLYPRESLSAMRAALQERGLGMTYLKDRDQAVANAYGAVCTPEVVVLDRRRHICYRGRIDDSLVASGVRRHYLRQAIRAAIRGRRVRVASTAPLGCSIDPVRANAIVVGATAVAGKASASAPARLPSP